MKGQLGLQYLLTYALALLLHQCIVLRMAEAKITRTSRGCCAVLLHQSDGNAEALGKTEKCDEMARIEQAAKRNK